MNCCEFDGKDREVFRKKRKAIFNATGKTWKHVSINKCIETAGLKQYQTFVLIKTFSKFVLLY